MNTEWKPDIVIYHSPCDDGFAAAFAAWLRWDDSVDYVPATYGRPPVDVAGKHVLIVDFSYKREILEGMAFVARSIVVLDHHKTARDDLAPFALEHSDGSAGGLCVEEVNGLLEDFAELGRPRIVALFDMERSGARMTWDFCHFGAAVPPLIRYVEDRDLWRFAMSDTRAFSLWLRAHKYDFRVWDRISAQLARPDDASAILLQATAIEGFYDQMIDRMAAGAFPHTIDGHMVPTVNCPGQFASDVGHRLLELNAAAPFVATYSDRYNGRGYSLRSEDGRIDVSAVAKRYGGGGHRNAAGFEVPA